MEKRTPRMPRGFFVTKGRTPSQTAEGHTSPARGQGTAADGTGRPDGHQAEGGGGVGSPMGVAEKSTWICCKTRYKKIAGPMTKE